MFGNWTFGTLVFTVMVITVTLKVSYTDLVLSQHESLLQTVLSVSTFVCHLLLVLTQTEYFCQTKSPTKSWWALNFHLPKDACLLPRFKSFWSSRFYEALRWRWLAESWVTCWSPQWHIAPAVPVWSTGCCVWGIRMTTVVINRRRAFYHRLGSRSLLQHWGR